MFFAFFRNIGLPELLILAFIIFLFSRTFARRAGNTIGQLKGAINGDRPPAPSPPRSEREVCLETLELPATATPEQIRQAYRELVKVWHPDRFSEASLKARAEEKLKEINTAYEKLERTF
ncbi:MAG TPA: J domain-containing protein [Planctomycetota bacterium]|nr:J domain-containing protein [Planctomycetota bacterium]